MTVSDDAGGEEGSHHFPATTDWPRGYGEASWWPFLSAAGAAGLYVGAALLVFSLGDDPPVPTIAGVVTVGASAALFLLGLFGWLYHAFVADFWERGTDHRSALTLRVTMGLFLVTEVATFGAGFVYYGFVRGGDVWRPELLPHGGVTGPLVFVNTAILVASSVTLHYAHVGLRRGDRDRFVRLLAATLGLGLVFVAGQVYEYYEFLVGEGFTLAEGLYASAFYGLTGLHGLHVSLGVVLLGIVLWRALRGQYGPSRHTSVSTVSMYWHFVDAVWLFLVVVLYVGAAVP